MEFYVGLHQPSDAKHFDRCMISVNRLIKRRSDFIVGRWMLDSGAFTAISRHGRYLMDVPEYAAHIRRWAGVGELVSATVQDVMCEPFITAKTGLSVLAHQCVTIRRYDRLLAEDTAGVHIMPVIQGYRPADYVRHLALYGTRLVPGAWVGVGSVCKRNGDVGAVEDVLSQIKAARPDLRLHGFGLKTTALESPIVRDLLHTADSMAWSYAARMAGRSANDWREARAFADRIEGQRLRPRQYRMVL